MSASTRNERSATTPFDRAAARVITAIQDRNHDRIAPADYQLVVRTLSKFAISYGRLASHDAEELARDTVAALCERAADQATIKQPSAYLFSVARNRVHDAARRERHTKIFEESQRAEIADSPGPDAIVRRRRRVYSSEDDTIARLLDQRVSAQLIEDALRAAAAANDRLVMRVISAWLSLAQQLGRRPSSREVAPVAGVSHTSVQAALRRFRHYVPSEGTGFASRDGFQT